MGRNHITCKCCGTVFHWVYPSRWCLYSQQPPQELAWYQPHGSKKEASWHHNDIRQLIDLEVEKTQYKQNYFNYLTEQGSFRPLTMHSWSYFSFFLEGHVDLTNPIPAWVFLISQYGESVSIIILSTGIPFTTSRFSVVFNEQPFKPAMTISESTRLLALRYVSPKIEVTSSGEYISCFQRAYAKPAKMPQRVYIFMV